MTVLYSDLEELIGGLEPIFRAQCAERSIEWRSRIPQRLPRVNIDREQIEQVLINIIKNGIEAIGENGVIDLEAENVGNHVVLRVYDNGSGLDPKHNNDLFTPFFTSKSTGQGLGLTLVKEVLLRHNFEFGLENAADGRTCFHIKM